MSNLSFFFFFLSGINIGVPERGAVNGSDFDLIFLDKEISDYCHAAVSDFSKGNAAEEFQYLKSNKSIKRMSSDIQDQRQLINQFMP